MTEREADDLLAGEEQELIPVIQGGLAEIKSLWASCLEQEIPATMMCPPGKT